MKTFPTVLGTHLRTNNFHGFDAHFSLISRRSMEKLWNLKEKTKQTTSVRTNKRMRKQVHFNLPSPSPEQPDSLRSRVNGAWLRLVAVIRVKLFFWRIFSSQKAVRLLKRRLAFVDAVCQKGFRTQKAPPKENEKQERKKSFFGLQQSPLNPNKLFFDEKRRENWKQIGLSTLLSTSMSEQSTFN